MVAWVKVIWGRGTQAPSVAPLVITNSSLVCGEELLLSRHKFLIFVTVTIQETI